MRKGMSLLAALTLLIFAAGCAGEDPGSVGNAEQTCKKPKAIYLALGDSVPFGENILLEPTPDVDLYVSYADFLAKPVGAGKDVNAACPGETTGSFFDPTAPDNGCRDFRRSGTTDPTAPDVDYETLHVEYTGTQLEFAVATLTDPKKSVKLVTLQLGANDLLLLLHECLGDQACIMAKIEQVLGQAGQNLATILYTIRVVAGYTGPIVMPFYYSTNYSDPLYTQSSYALNQVIAQVASMFGAVTADVFSAWYVASGGDPCAAGLLIKLPDGTCDMHPSEAGHKLIADTILAALRQ